MGAFECGMGVVEVIEDLRSHRRNLSSSQTITGLVLCVVVGWTSFTLANIPLVSPFALLGFPHDFLFWDVWWLVGNLVALCCMFFIGGLIRYMSERKQRTHKKLSGDSRLNRRITKKSSLASPKPTKATADIGENTKYTRQHFITELPRPHLGANTPRGDLSNGRYADYGTPMKARLTPLGGMGYQKTRRSPHLTSPLSALESDVTSSVLAAEEYVDEQVNKAQTPLRLQWNHQVREYSPALVEETRSSKPDPRSPSSMEAEEVLQSLGIENEIYEWGTNMRAWLKRRLQRVQQMVRQVTLCRQSGNTNVPTDVVAYVSSLQSRFPESCQEYVMERVQELGRDDTRSSDWKWDSGGSFRGKAWTSELPTDAELLMQIFCVEMDSKIRDVSCKEFTRKYYVEGRFEKKIYRPITVGINQRKNTKGITHFDIIHLDEVKKVAEGRNNVYNALVLFVYLVKKEMNGCLEQISLGNSEINLLSVIRK